MSILEMEHVGFKIPTEQGEREIIHDIKLVLEPGRLVVVTGPNGGGKSTLARLIAGISLPTAGRIILDGKDITAKGVTERARMGVGFAFQQPVRFKGIRVLDLLRLAAGKELSVSDACEYLSAVGLCAIDYIHREINASLSGGELKRIEIATVFARGVRFSIFDEPEAGIDLWSFQNLIRLFKEMRGNIPDSTIMIISHQEKLMDIADEIVVMKDGSVDRHGLKDDILPGLAGSPLAVGGCCKNGQGRLTQC